MSSPGRSILAHLKYTIMQRRSDITPRIQAHYVIEKQLAQRLRSASKEERRRLYSAVYDELFRSIPDHPQLLRKASIASAAQRVEGALRILQPFLKPGSTFLEVGAGDCAVSIAVAAMVGWVYAIDVSIQIADREQIPANFQLILSDGTSIPVPEGSIDVAYSNQLMEHLHPDDALEQLYNIHRALRPGGLYICSTPNRLRGPHDISKYFDEVATGLHLKEYTIAELYCLFKKTGFVRQRFYISVRKNRLLLPLLPFRIFECTLKRLPRWVRQPIASLWLMSEVLGIRIVATK